METGDIIRVRTVTTIRRSKLVQSEVKYRAPKGKEFVLLVIGAATPDEDIGALSTKVLNALGWDLRPEDEPADAEADTK